MVYSSSAADGYLSPAGDASRTLGPQLQWAAVGLVLMLVAMRLDYRWLRLASVPLLLVAGVLVVLVQFKAFQVTVGGSAQWLKLPGLPAIQPSELAKLALVIYLAHWMARRGGAVAGLRTGLLPFVVIVAPFVLLIFKSPDIGSAGVLGVTAVLMFFMAGANLFHLAGSRGDRGRRRGCLPAGATSSPASSRSSTPSPTPSATATSRSRASSPSASAGSSAAAWASARQPAASSCRTPTMTTSSR